MKNEKEFNTPEGREWIHGVLKNHNVEVVFVKKDGTERTMFCTLNENNVPVDKIPKNTGRSKPQESIAVFDIEKQEWRSFRFDSLKRLKFSIE